MKTCAGISRGRFLGPTSQMRNKDMKDQRANRAGTGHTAVMKEMVKKIHPDLEFYLNNTFL